MLRRYGPIALVAVLAAGAAVLWTASADETIPLTELARRTHFHGIAVDRSDPSRLFLATHHGFYAVAPDGTATRLSPVQDFMGFTPHPSDPSLLFASGHPAEGGNLGFIVSSDGGETWTQLSPGAEGTADFHQLDVSGADPKVVYGAYAGKLQVSGDGGRNWTIAGAAPEGLIDLAASPAQSERVYAATRFGLWVSGNIGQSWKEVAFGQDIVALVENGKDTDLYAFVVGRGLLKTDEAHLDGWRVLSNDFGERALIHLAVDPTDESRLYAITTESEVLASRDGGATWTPLGAQ